MTIRISGQISGRRIELEIDGLDSPTPLQFVQSLEDGQLSILAHHLRARMEERGFAWNPRVETPAERQQREAAVPEKLWKSGGGAGQWNG